MPNAEKDYLKNMSDTHALSEPLIPSDTETSEDLSGSCAVILDEDGQVIRTYAERMRAIQAATAAYRLSAKGKADDKEVVPHLQGDRRLLPYAPAKDGIRTGIDRRGLSEMQKGAKKRVLNPSHPEHRGVRFTVEMPVTIICSMQDGRKERFTAQCHNISTSGMLLTIGSQEHIRLMQESTSIKLDFHLEPGRMPEGYEMHYRLGATMVFSKKLENGDLNCGMQFVEPLTNYAYRHRGRGLHVASIAALVLLVALILVMRITSGSVGPMGRIAYVYSMITSAYLLTRYLFGALYRPTPANPDFTPGVSIVVPCYNEEDWIQRTIISCLNQAYPLDKLEVIIVDDHSRDQSPEKIEQILTELDKVDALYDTKSRVRYVRQTANLGKRDAMARGTALARHDLVVFVDSDSFLDPHAIINLVQPFQDPKVGGVSGRTDVANSYTNMLTRMQAVKYYFSFRVLKAAEGYFNAVTCLSGPLSCYRREALMKNMEAWLNQRFLGRKATFGDDRSMTNFVLREYRTDYQDTAVCSTIVPAKHKMFLRQQMRWKRSWLRETAIAARFIWKKEPFMAVSFYTGFILPIVAPAVIFLNMLWTPFYQGVFPLIFVMGFLAMSLMMCFAQLLMRRSTLWWYGLLYNVYHILVLVWQMPIAWFTFWKSTWGTRMTTSDLQAKPLMRKPRTTAAGEK